jgi:scyllo-inositol 2-dehydrogenase (NADP+)
LPKPNDAHDVVYWIIAFLGEKNVDVPLKFFIVNIPLRVGMAAFGMSGRVFHAPLITAHPYMELAVIHERSTQKSKESYPDVTVAENYESMLADETLDLIVVNTPQHLHFDMCKKALSAGKHVVVEKPFTVTSQEAKELIGLSRINKKILAVFQNRRWDGDFLTVEKIVENNLLGKLVTFENHFDRYRNYIQENTWKEEDNFNGAGLLYNLGPHLIDQVICLFGLPKAVMADIRTVWEGGKVDDYFNLILHYDRLRASVRSSYLVREPYPRFTLHGTSGSFIKYGLDPQEEALNACKNPGKEKLGQD